MPRLIDADKLIEALDLWGCYKYENPEAYDTLMKYEILQEIEAQPTAYDVEKVLEELENETCVNLEDVYKEAIDIVKRGGIDEG